MRLSLVTFTIVVAAFPAVAQQAAPARPQPARPAAQPARPAAKPATPAPAIGGAQPTLVGQYGDWGAYTASPAGKKLCFALAKPAKAATNPPNRPRDPIYMFIASRPAEKVKDEVSIVIGYGFKPSAEASLDVAGAQFAMYTQNDGAWIKNAADETRLVEALRRGTDAVIKGTSARGTQSTDTFSLKGLAQALDKVGQECR
jgi:hypothetical protein